MKTRARYLSHANIKEQYFLWQIKWTNIALRYSIHRQKEWHSPSGKRWLETWTNWKKLDTNKNSERTSWNFKMCFLHRAECWTTLRNFTSTSKKETIKWQYICRIRFIVILVWPTLKSVWKCDERGFSNIFWNEMKNSKRKTSKRNYPLVTNIFRDWIRNGFKCNFYLAV